MPICRGGLSRFIPAALAQLHAAGRGVLEPRLGCHGTWRWSRSLKGPDRDAGRETLFLPDAARDEIRTA